jgi:hypothetical protein
VGTPAEVKSGFPGFSMMGGDGLEPPTPCL